MIPVWLTIGAVKKFGPWVAIVLLLIGIYVFGHSRGAAKWKIKYDAANIERKEAVSDRDQALAAVAVCNEATEKYKIDAEARVARLVAELQREPEIITKYRDRVEVVERVIRSEDCADALIEVDEVLRGVDPP